MSAVTVIAYLIAIAIPAFTVYLFVALDIFGTGKTSTILICLAWGVAGAFSLAWTINNAMIDAGVRYETVTGFTGPLIEELLKSLILIYLVQHPRFRYIVDGAVYGIAVGIGFALSENLFVYLRGSGSAVLGTAITRTLSTSLMHAAASGLVGISLGRLRRSRDKFAWTLLGIGLAVTLHIVYNNIVRQLGGPQLLLVAVGIGIGGSSAIAWQIIQGLADEKKRFAVTLGLNVGVSTGERKAVQQLGGTSIEQIFGDLGDFFGEDNVTHIRRLLVIQANIGILQNNLNSPVSERLRKAWEEEIAEYRVEFERIRKELGPAVKLFMQSVFPSSDTKMQDAFNEEIAQFDPTLVHTFDMFMRVSELAEKFTPEQLEAMAERLSKIDIFRHVSLANLENLSRAITVLNFDDGHVLFNQGDEGDAMYLIEQGHITIYARDHTGQEKLLRAFDAGDVVGEFALLDGQPRSARAQASSGPLQALMLQRPVFMQFIQSRPGVILAVLQYLAEKARFTTQAVETSITWMTQIAEGSYQTSLDQLPAFDTAPATPVAPAQEEMPAVTLDPEELSADTPALISRVFSKAAVLLQERERALRGKAQPKSP